MVGSFLSVPKSLLEYIRPLSSGPTDFRRRDWTGFMFFKSVFQIIIIIPDLWP